ncbi:hypothetical protein BDW75DRAFT_220511 [Aspergillus navahoensis]
MALAPVVFCSVGMLLYLGNWGILGWMKGASTDLGSLLETGYKIILYLGRPSRS